jgi:hypothetical protein
MIRLTSTQLAVELLVPLYRHHHGDFLTGPFHEDDIAVTEVGDPRNL